jgi:hypothetical protein
MCTVNEKYQSFVAIESGKKVLYLQLLKALYGCVRSALLWYELFATTLKKMGFVLNPYDPCVANKMIDGKQCTIVWYVDDNKISHVNKNVVTNIIEEIEKNFGKMSVTRGKNHTFLGMKLTLIDDGTVKVDMKDYVLEAMKDCQDDVSKPAATPAKKNLFDVDKRSPLLEKTKAERFHSVVAKLLYIAKRGRIDIQLAIAFLCTRVSCSTEDDWSKLKRVLQYLGRTKDDFLILGADCLTILKTWVDASYGVHSDMKSHTGGAMSLGRGTIMCKSTKQKLNTKSSTEAELVGASDFLPNTIWAKMFLSAQGYTVEENVFFQDNQSAMKLEVNGRASCGQKSRHIDIRYFFMKDRIKTENITIVYCPTEEMLADFFTKPLQGKLFEKFKRVLMGQEHINTLVRRSSTTVEERVELSNLTEDSKVATVVNEQTNKFENSTSDDAQEGWKLVLRGNQNKTVISDNIGDNSKRLDKEKAQAANRQRSANQVILSINPMSKSS